MGVLSSGLQPELKFLPASIATDLLTGLVSWWDFESGSIDQDSHTGDLDLTETGSVSSVTGFSGDAAGGFSTSDYLSSDSATFNFSGTFYLSFFLNTPDVVTSQAFVSKWVTAGNQRAYEVRLVSGEIRFAVSSDGSDSEVVASDAVSADEWHFIECYYSAERRDRDRG